MRGCRPCLRLDWFIEWSGPPYGFLYVRLFGPPAWLFWGWKQREKLTYRSFYFSLLEASKVFDRHGNGKACPQTAVSLSSRLIDPLVTRHPLSLSWAHVCSIGGGRIIVRSMRSGASAGKMLCDPTVPPDATATNVENKGASIDLFAARPSNLGSVAARKCFKNDPASVRLRL